MRAQCWLTVLVAALLSSGTAQAEDLTGKVRKAAERSTLDQAGTHPFHLKAIMAPSLERDKDSGRTGEVEIRWESPTQWKREVRSPQFHQIEIVNGTHDWQENEVRLLSRVVTASSGRVGQSSATPPRSPRTGEGCGGAAIQGKDQGRGDPGANEH